MVLGLLVGSYLQLWQIVVFAMIDVEENVFTHAGAEVPFRVVVVRIL